MLQLPGSHNNIVLVKPQYLFYGCVVMPGSTRHLFLYANKFPYFMIVRLWSILSSYGGPRLFFCLSYQSCKNRLCVWVASNVESRILEHKGTGSFFSSANKCCVLMYYEVYSDVFNSIARAKQLK
jgi:hypothetical protein